MAADLSFDLVVATIGRVSELSRFLESLAVQSQPHVRAIIVDQNPDDRVARVIDAFAPHVPILRLQSPPGLSRARNVGLAHLEADVIAFPDDDCWYPPRLLHDVAEALAADTGLDGFSVRARDGRGRISSLRWDDEPGLVDRYNVWRRAISFSFFLRSHVLASVGEFDTELGVGSGTRWGSGEETDYLLRAVDAGFRLQFEPSLFVCHESPKPTLDSDATRNAYLRGLGHSEVLRRHGYPLWFAAWRVAQLVAGSAFFLFSGRFARARYYTAMAFGRARGWLDRRGN